MALRLGLIYGVLSVLWILYSDQAALLLHDDPVLLTRVQSYKGWAFVILSAILIFVLVYRDLVKLLKAQADLDESRSLLNAMLENSPALLYMKDPEGRYLFANEHFLRVTGTKWPALEGRTDGDIFPEEVAAALRENDRQVAESGETRDYREVLPDFERKERSYISVKFPVRDAAGGIAAVCGISSDITERELLEQRVEQNERLHALGRLTGGIAHDFNNHLSVIRGNLELMASTGEGQAPDPDCVRDARHAAHQAAELVARLLAFSRNQVLVVTDVDVNAAVAGIRKLISRSIGETIAVELDLLDAPLYARLDKVQLESALLNLAVNARDAMPRGGILRIRTRRATLTPEQAEAESVEAGDYVCIAVEDTGEGIARDKLARVREPFFTTKEPGKGTGLGLSMVDGFVRQSGGCMQISSELGAGTVVSIYAPLVKPGAEAALAFDAERAGAYPGGQGEVILVVEDQAALREFAVKVLRSHGYTVKSAEDGRIAEQIITESPHIDLLFSDVVLPGGVLGTELSARFAARFPGGRAILTTGYADFSRYTGDNGAITVPVLRKPYGVSDLLQCVAGALRNTGSAARDS